MNYRVNVPLNDHGYDTRNYQCNAGWHLLRSFLEVIFFPEVTTAQVNPRKYHKCDIC